MVSQKSIITILFLYRSRSSFENLALWQNFHISYGLVISAREIAFYEAKSKLPKSGLTDRCNAPSSTKVYSGKLCNNL